MEMSKDPGKFKALIGLDGFVDEILCAVDKRHSTESFTKIPTISAFAERVSRAAGLSTNIEFVGTTRKLGGNGPIMANALAEQGVSVSCIGAFGEEAVHPVFQPLKEKCKEFISIAEPGMSFCPEFEDGKLILSKPGSMNGITWEALKEKIGIEKLTAMISDPELNLFGLENWTMLPYMSGIFEGIINEVFPLMKPGNCLAFFDLADPEKRPVSDLSEALKLIMKFSERFRTVLGVNLKEAAQVAEALGIDVKLPGGSPEEADYEELTVKIGEALGIYCFVIHMVRDACAWSGGKYSYARGYYTPKPKLTTGAGDNFNAGLCLGLMMGLPIEEALGFGTASSGFYVREARSAGFAELTDFIKNGKSDER